MSDEAAIAVPLVRLACAGCGTRLPGVEQEPYPFRCSRARAGDGIDHVVRRRLDPSVWSLPLDPDPNPFIRYRRRLYSWHVARAHGIGDDEFVALAAALDEAVSAVDGRGFRVTPLGRPERLALALGMSAPGVVWVKDETGNVSGSHKGRHLMGLMLYLRVVDRLRARGTLSPTGGSRRLAIASCGNAALAAAVVACAAGEPLDVFVPPWAEPRLVARLRDLGAQVAVCERHANEAGDPCYLRFRESLDRGSLPFCCQGPDNGLAIEGGETLVYELLDQLAPPGAGLDRLFVQVGGGALASACTQALLEAKAAGRIPRLPRLHAVQTLGGYPLARAWQRIAGRAVAAGRDTRGAADAPAVERILAHAAAHRREFMWPWETEPRSLAHGILDDETYDWLAVVEGMLRSGGWPIVVSEDDVTRANDIAQATTGVAVDHTGSAGLAGLVQMRDAAAAGDARPEADPRREQIVVLFTGARRSPPHPHPLPRAGGEGRDPQASRGAPL